MYKITIKGYNKGTFTYAQRTVNVVEPKIVKDENGQDTIEYVPTGATRLEDFETNDIEEAKQKYIELLENHKKDELNLIDDITETVTVIITIAEDEVEPDIHEDSDDV